MIIICSECKKEFHKYPSQMRRSKSGKHFCSKSCSASFNNREDPKRKREGTCCFCKKNIPSKKKFCNSKCKSNYKTTLSTSKCSWYACPNMSHTKFCSSKCKNKYYVQSRRWKTKLKAIEYKGGKCERCGYNKCYDALEFHHLNPDEKDFAIGSGNTYSWERTKSEIDKCIMLCANCHREEHFRLKPKWKGQKIRLEATPNKP